MIKSTPDGRFALSGQVPCCFLGSGLWILHRCNRTIEKAGAALKIWEDALSHPKPAQSPLETLARQTPSTAKVYRRKNSGSPFGGCDMG